MNQVEFYEAKLQFETDSWDLFADLQNGEQVVVVDVRAREAYETEHIPTAMNFPHATMSAVTTSNLDQAKTYVTYCDGIGCNGSTKGALKLAQLGFKVKELLGGIAWWKRDGYATEGREGQPGKTLNTVTK